MIVEVLTNAYAWTIVGVLTTIYLFAPRNTSPFPTINNYPDDYFSRRAMREFRENAAHLIIDGLAKHNGPVTVAIPRGQKIVLPSSLTSWVKTNKDLDHEELVKDDFFSGFPGFEAQTVLHSPDENVIGTIKTKLGQNDATVAVVNTSIVNALSIHWGNGKSWTTIDWQKDTMGIIARAASSIFIGPEKADDPEWLELIQDYVRAYFSAVGQLQQYPPWCRWLVHWFLPNAIVCRTYVSKARMIVDNVLRARMNEVALAERDSRSPPVYNDVLAWTAAAKRGTDKAGDVQLSLAMAALVTTTELFRQTLIEIAGHPELVEALREEVSREFAQHGISVSATSNMFLLDSVLKECQRLSSGPVALERKALKETALPDGKVIPKNAHTMVDATDLWNPEIYPNPLEFDGYRFLRKRDTGEQGTQFVQSSKNFKVFGAGRHICPGRFFANVELKLALANVLLKYDIQLAESYKPNPMRVGFYFIGDPCVKLEIRKRDNGDD